MQNREENYEKLLFRKFWYFMLNVNVVKKDYFQSNIKPYHLQVTHLCWGDRGELNKCLTVLLITGVTKSNPLDLPHIHILWFSVMKWRNREENYEKVIFREFRYYTLSVMRWKKTIWEQISTPLHVTNLIRIAIKQMFLTYEETILWYE